MMKKLFALTLALLLALSLTACGGDKPTDDTTGGEDQQQTDDANTPDDSSSSDGSAEGLTISVAASPTPHAEILNQCVPILAEQGITLTVNEYSDYVIPNTAVEDGDEDANFFQHVPYLDNFNAERGTHLVNVAGVHIEPMGLYLNEISSLDDLPDGATVAVPNDATNEGRALLLLEAQGLIKLKDGAGLEVTPNDIVENPKNLEFLELEAANVPANLDEVSVAAINSNYALGAGLNPTTDAAVLENADNPYVNVLVVKEGNEQNPAVLALIEALHSDAIRDYINDTFGGAVLPAF